MDLKTYLAGRSDDDLVNDALTVVREEVLRRYPMVGMFMLRYEPDVRAILLKIVRRWRTS